MAERAAPIVETRCGRVRGGREAGVEVYRGIRYAAPPVGARRFRPPAPPEPWSGVRDALEFGPDAPQPADSGLTLLLDAPRPQSEDCLTLNVWTPAADDARRPVMVWVHGGGWTFGSSSSALYDGSRLARRGDVVVVSLNYRLGVLGLLTHPALADEETGALGNWGFLDQIAALEWVRDNVERFGGDSDRVTIFGESAGGASVGLLAAAPRARGLFRGVILQSASPMPAPRESAVRAAEAVFSAIGCKPDDLSALRTVALDVLMKTLDVWRPIASRGRTAPRPSLDGVTLVQDPLQAVDAGATRGIALLLGSTRDEAKLLLFDDPKRGKLDEAGLRRRLEGTLAAASGDAIDRVIAVYREARAARGESVEPWELWAAMQTDRMIRAPSLRFAERHAARGEPAHTYLFTWEARAAALGACHALELPFCFGTLDAPGMKAFAGGGADAERLSNAMQDAWLSFARGDGPGTPALGEWPAYEAKRRATMVFGRECALEFAPRDPERSVWEPFLDAD